MLDPQLFLNGLADNGAVIPLRIDSLIRTSLPDHAVVSCSALELREYAKLGHCEIEQLPEPAADQYLSWGGEDYDKLFLSFNQVAWGVKTQTCKFTVVQTSRESSCGTPQRDWVIAEDEQSAREFILDVERKTNDPHGSILVFNNGRWGRSTSHYEAIQSASFDDLILADDLKQRIRSDFSQFLASEEQYKTLGIPWRRGALLTGPPGNGKTHCLRALLRELAIPCLYLESLSHSHLTSEQMWQGVFRRARKISPAVLVLEDLDSIVDDSNRSYFLNQLDGLEPTSGLIILATTNHPERIDPAILNRPSRFDRKYHFHLPAEKERKHFLALWQKRLQDETDWQTEEIDALTEKTEGYSFAYLKELMVSALMEWMEKRQGNFSQLVIRHAEILRNEMSSSPGETE
ncbi:MAG: ATP-binding protein [Planctomycetota bacterium]